MKTNKEFYWKLLRTFYVRRSGLKIKTSLGCKIHKRQLVLIENLSTVVSSWSKVMPRHPSPFKLQRRSYKKGAFKKYICPVRLKKKKKVDVLDLLKDVELSVWSGTQGPFALFHPGYIPASYPLFFRDELWIRRDPELDKALTEDKGMLELSKSIHECQTRCMCYIFFTSSFRISAHCKKKQKKEEIKKMNNGQFVSFFFIHEIIT